MYKLENNWIQKRLSFDEKAKEKFKKEIKNIDLSQNRLNILLSIIEVILYLNKNSIVLILAQYKRKNIEYFNSFHNHKQLH